MYAALSHNFVILHDSDNHQFLLIFSQPCSFVESVFGYGKIDLNYLSGLCYEIF